MATFDYHCNGCAFEAEYRNVSSGDTPECRSCGSVDMSKLPSTIRIGGTSMKKVDMEDFYAPKKGLEVALGVAECECGETVPCIGVRPVTIPGGPSMN